MTFLEKVETGKKEINPIICAAGTSGVGKTTFVASAPFPILLPLEDGAFQIDTARLPRPKTFSEAMRMIDELIASDHEYKTLGVDSIDWLETLAQQEVCHERGAKNVSDIPYGQGFSATLTKFQEFIQKIKQLRSKMIIILICHAQIKQFSDPVTGASYDRYTLKLHEKVAALIREAVDVLLFMNYETLVRKDGLKSKAFGDGKRVMFTQYRPAHDGKSRYNLPYEMPLDWDEFYAAIKSGEPIKPDTIKQELSAMIATIKDAGLKEKVILAIDQAGENTVQLSKIQNRLRLKLES